MYHRPGCLYRTVWLGNFMFHVSNEWFDTDLLYFSHLCNTISRTMFDSNWLCLYLNSKYRYLIGVFARTSTSIPYTIDIVVYFTFVFSLPHVSLQIYTRHANVIRCVRIIEQNAQRNETKWNEIMKWSNAHLVWQTNP